MLQSYVNDLSEQNSVLVQTVEELEREANDRVVLLEGKLHRSTNTIKVNKCTSNTNKLSLLYHKDIPKPGVDQLMLGISNIT